MKPVAQFRRCIPAIVTAVLAAVVATPAARAGGEPDLVSALCARGAQIVPLGARGGLAGYLVTPAGGAGYSLYVTADGHGVAGLLYGPDGALITGGQLAAARGGSDSVGPAPHGPSMSPSIPAMDRASPPRGVCGSAVSGGPAVATPGAETMERVVSDRTPKPDTANGVSRGLLFERATSAFGFTLGDRGPLVVLFGDARCPWSRSAVARIGRKAMAGKLRLHVVPVALLGAASAHSAAGIAASSDPAQAWFARDDGPAGLEARGRIARNNALFDAWGERSVPLIAYRTARGESGRGGIAHRVGDIADLDAWLQELGDE